MKIFAVLQDPYSSTYENNFDHPARKGKIQTDETLNSIFERLRLHQAVPKRYQEEYHNVASPNSDHLSKSTSSQMHFKAEFTGRWNFWKSAQKNQKSGTDSTEYWFIRTRQSDRGFARSNQWRQWPSTCLVLHGVMALQFHDITVCESCNHRFFPMLEQATACPKCESTAIRPSKDHDVFELLYQLSINEKTKFKTASEWEKWVTDKSFNICQDGETILRVLYTASSLERCSRKRTCGLAKSNGSKTSATRIH